MNDFKTTFPKLPNRTELKYREIEGFQPHEFFVCILYESAIRVPSIKSILLKFSELYGDAKKQYKEKSLLLNYLYTIHSELELNKMGFDLDASIFFANKQDDPNFNLKRKELLSAPNKYEESKHNDIIELTLEDDGTISRKCLNTKRVEIEELLKIWEQYNNELLEMTDEIPEKKDLQIYEELLENRTSIIENFSNDENSKIEEYVQDEEQLEYLQKIVRNKSINSSINWAEFDFSPIFNLKLSMQRPLLKDRIKHKYFSIDFNLNLPLKELEIQLKDIKKAYDEHSKCSREVEEKYLASMKEKLPKRFYNFPNKLSVLPNIHINPYLLTAGEIGCTNGSYESTHGTKPNEDIEYINFFKQCGDISFKKQNRSKIYADIFYIYDSIKLIEEYNKCLEIEKEALCSEIKLQSFEDEEETLNDLENLFKKKVISRKKAMVTLHNKINSNTISEDQAPSTVSDKWAHARELIDEGMYQSLM